MKERISESRDPRSGPSKKALKLETRRSRERMRYVNPQNCGKILAHHRYWTRQFLARYLERCDIESFDEPRNGYLLARHAPEVARRIRVGARAPDFRSETEKAGFEVRALAVQASTCRAADELAEAEVVFQRAFDRVRRGPVEPLAVADLERRYAAYLAVTRKAEADAHLERSLELCRRHDDPAGEADALALRGYISFHSGRPGAVADFVGAMRLADTRTRRGKTTYQMGLHNLTGTLLLRGTGLREQESALLWLQELKNALKGRALSVRKVKLVWIEGLMLRNLGIDRHAERQLRKAREGFADLEQPLDFALVSLDLGYLLSVGGETEAARELGRETCRRLREMADDPALIEAVCEWPRTVLAADALSALRRAVGKMG